MKIAHIINVTDIDDSKKASYLHIAQPLTIKSMIVAKNMAKDIVDIELYAVKHKDEKVDIPEPFTWTKQLDKYAYDYIDVLKNSKEFRPLPCLKDILRRLYDISDAEYFVFTNVDIGLKPHFYLRVRQFIEEGFDAFCINRRDLPKEFEGITLDVNTLELAYMIDGKKHPGSDCFVFKRDIVDKLQLNKVFVGFPPVGNVLKAQLQRHARNFNVFRDSQLTFHLGEDKAWKTIHGIYHQENLNQADGLYERRRKTVIHKLSGMLKKQMSKYTTK